MSGRPLLSRPPRSFLPLLFAALVVAPLLACSSDATGPEIPGELVGRWDATSMVLTSVDDPDISADLVQDERFGGSFELIIRADGSYEATLIVFGTPQGELGTLEVSGSTLIFHPDQDAGGTPGRATWSVSGDRLTLDGETTFDFNQDQQDEEATLHIELVRS